MVSLLYVGSFKQISVVAFLGELSYVFREAGMAEQVDAPDLKSGVPKAREGSSPSLRTREFLEF